MLQQRRLADEKLFFSILKAKNKNISDICIKLNNNVKNIKVLADEELFTLWEHVEPLSPKAQEIYTQPVNKDNRSMKEYSVIVKQTCVIVKLGFETILLKKSFMPGTLWQNVTILHSTILPNIKDEQVKDMISEFLENWWKLNIVRKEEIIQNTLKHLIQMCESSLKHLKRLCDVKSAIVLLKCPEDLQKLYKLVQQKSVISSREGRIILVHLFSLGENYILPIHYNVKVMLQNEDTKYMAHYAELYTTAWSNVTLELKKVIVQNCLQELMLHCFRANRDATGREKLGQNLLVLLTSLHDRENQAVKRMINYQCRPLLWKYLKAPGAYIRCNAAEILFVTNPIQYVCTSKRRNETIVNKYFQAITELLEDSDFQVCNIAIHGIFEILEKHWSNVTNNIIKKWLNILLSLTETRSNVEIRMSVFAGFKQLTTKEHTHATLRDFLPNFANSIYDVNVTVVEGFIELLCCAQKNVGIPVWDIVPMAYILDRLETTKDTTLLPIIVKFIWLQISGTDIDNYNNTGQKLLYIGINNVNAVRKFCLNSKSVINLNVSLNLVKTILSMIKKEKESLFTTRRQEIYCKRFKKSNKGNQHDNARTVKHTEKEYFSEHQNIHILIDIIAMLLFTNADSIDYEYLNTEQKAIIFAVANSLPELSNYFTDTPVHESIIFLFSLISPIFFSDQIAIIEPLVKKLCDPDVSEDMLIAALYVLVKWEKGETILFALTSLLTESINTDLPNNQENCSNSNISKVKVKGLELSLRILKHLLHAEYRSILLTKYHSDVLKFWETLHILRPFVGKTLSNNFIFDSMLLELAVDFFSKYLSLVPLLHKMDVFDASERFSEILQWVKREIVPHVPKINNIENFQPPIHIVKNTIDISSLLLKQRIGTSKFCCDIVLLCSTCVLRLDGIVFMNNVIEILLNLLDFGRIAFDNGDSNVLGVVVPNLLNAAMITLPRYTENIVIKYTNNLKFLSRLTEKYFLTVDNTFQSSQMYLSFITIMFDTAVSSITTEMTRVLQKTPLVKEDILIIKYPYLAGKILNIILRTQKYQELTLQALSKGITRCSQIDMLSSLLITYKIIKAPKKTLVNRLKNISLAAKLHSQRQSFTTPFERSTDNAISIVIDAMLQQ